MTPDEREALRRLECVLAEGLRDVVAEMRELRRLVERPPAAAQDRDGRFVLALAGCMGADALPFKPEEVLDAARHDAALAAAMEALGLRSGAALGYWLRARRGRVIAGFRICRDEERRLWWLEPASR